MEEITLEGHIASPSPFGGGIFHPIIPQPTFQTHSTAEANAGTTPCILDVDPGILGNIILYFTGNDAPKIDIGAFLPEWKDVEDGQPVELTGVVIPGEEDYPFPSVSFDDLPISHFTHDFCFPVKPDDTADGRFDRLLARNPDGTRAQRLIWVEWECGLGASNDDNPLKDANTSGRSGGFYTAGHQRRDTIWNWPTINDHVYVVGRWIWDRGHKPRTEVHPPRLVAVQRANPTLIPTMIGIDPGPNRFTTRIDIFASGDGGALTNNRDRQPSFVKKVPMDDRDYRFTVTHPLPKPSESALVTAWEQRHTGDTFPGVLDISHVTVAFPPDQQPPPELAPQMIIGIPWQTRSAPHDAVVARTIFLSWDQGTGVAADYKAHRYTVTLNDLRVNASEDLGDGEYRAFAAVDCNYVFLNELPGDDNILDDGLGDTGDDQTWGIGRSFDIVVPFGGAFRVHAGGWEADGVNDVFGRLIDPSPRCDQQTKDWFNDNLFSSEVARGGGLDDPIGQVNTVWRVDTASGELHLEENAAVLGVGEHRDSSIGQISPDISDTNPNNAFTLHYTINQVW
ncbi:hypothetical protein ACFV29_11635 [Streptomyces sp. NPDC059690]|uniref:hypothetical protein n=1 Tax=Streptomyces sp. NPDC059690 TaxID=3346907 RepID=UPI00369FFCFD